MKVGKMQVHSLQFGGSLARDRGRGEAAAFVAGNGKRFISQTQSARYSQLVQCSN